MLGRLAGSGGGRSLMLNGHSDTVDAPGMAEPFSGDIRDGKVYGRGSFDMKGSVAACMTAAKALADSGMRLRGDVLVAAVADEEYGSLGTRDLIERVRVDGAIVTEPTATRSLPGAQRATCGSRWMWRDARRTAASSNWASTPT